MPITVDDFLAGGPNTSISLDMCDRMLRDSHGTSVNGNLNAGHADMHALGDGHFGHLTSEYRDREKHSMFASHVDAVTAVYAALSSAGGRAALIELKKREERVAIHSKSEPNTQMRITMGHVLPFAPVMFESTSANVRMVLDRDRGNGRLHIQTLFPVQDLDRELEGNGGVQITSTVITSRKQQYFSGEHRIRTEYAEVNLVQYGRILR